MSKTILEPIIVSNDVVVQFTDTVVIDKKLYITVPATFKAIMFVDEEPISRIDECNNQSIYEKLNKDKKYLKKKLKIAFFRTNAIPEIEWGFGDVSVNNGEEIYFIGANGQVKTSIEDRIEIIKLFGTTKKITVDDISSKIKIYIQNTGRTLFSEYFNSNAILYDKVDSYQKTLGEKLKKELTSENGIKNLGLKIDDITIRSIFKKDLKIIKEIKSDVTTEELNSLKKEVKNKFDEISTKLNNNGIDINAIKVEIMSEVESLTKDSITQKDLNALKEDIEDKIENIDFKSDDTANLDEIYNFIKGVEERLNVSLDTKINSIKQIYENAIEEKEQEKLELYEKAKEDYIKDLKLTTDLLIEKADTDEDLAAPAGVIYSNVELNLTRHPDLNHVGNLFITSQENYYNAAKEIMVKNSSLLSAFTKRVYEIKDGIEYIEVPTEFRFIIYGLSVEDALQAAKDWTLLNKCRHLSIENKEKLERALKDRGITRKEFLKYILEFYRRVNLFTKD